MIELTHVSKDFGKGQQEVHAVRDVSLSIDKGEIFGIIGFSGAGKSTLVRCINLLERPTAGTVMVDDKDLTALSARELRQARKKIGMIFQNTGASLCPIRTIEEQLYEAVLEHESISKGEIRDRALELFEQLRFSNGAQILKSYPFEFSGGMNQRVGIVLAMVLRPRLLLADEPTSALDVTVQLQVLREMQKLRDMYGTSIVLVTHNIGVVNYLADHVAVMYQGKLVEYGTKEEILNHPQEAYTKKLIGSVLHLKRK